MVENTRVTLSLNPEELIWNLMPVPGKPWMVVEVRNEQRRKVHFLCWDYRSNSQVWQTEKLPESWWITLISVGDEVALLKIFESTENPDRTRWYPISVSTGTALPLPPDLKHNYTIELIRPFQYLAGESDFDKVKSFLTEQMNCTPVLGLEYLESQNLIFISFYHGNPAEFANTLAVFSLQGSLQWQEEIGMNLKGIGVNTFFLVADRIFFVKNKSELVTFRIV